MPQHPSPLDRPAGWTAEDGNLDGEKHDCEIHRGAEEDLATASFGQPSASPDFGATCDQGRREVPILSHPKTQQPRSPLTHTHPSHTPHTLGSSRLEPQTTATSQPQEPREEGGDMGNQEDRLTGLCKGFWTRTVTATAAIVNVTTKDSRSGMPRAPSVAKRWEDGRGRGTVMPVTQ